VSAGSPSGDGAPQRHWFTLGLSLRHRVGRFALLIVALAVLVTGLGGYLATRLAAISAVDDVLAATSAAAVRALGPAPDAAAVDRYVLTEHELGPVVTAVVRADGRVVRVPGSDVLTVQDRDVAVAAGRSGPRTHLATSGTGAFYRVRVVPVGRQPGVALLVAQPLRDTRQVLASLALALAACGSAAVVGAGLVGRRVARVSVAPVLELTAEVEQRAADDDLKPVNVSRVDEIGRLATAFNHVLDSVKVSRTRQSRFVADAGHELRTPLTSMRTNIELLTADSAHAMLSPADRVLILRDVHAQLMEFSTLVSDLIGLTREDRTAADFDEVDLTAVLEEAVDRVSVRAPGLRWVVELDPVSLHGDADLLARAFTNVLDNAVKYSPVGGTVSVTLRGAQVQISDEGRGVSPAERPFVFDRFYRSEASRATPGTGLGLSITESVVRQHGGSVTVTDAAGGGALFVLTFPVRATRSDHDEAPVRSAEVVRPPLALGGAGV
jgi:two-component system, OmpR family, sensor histidine kinase MprB